MSYRPLGISTSLFGAVYGMDCPESVLEVLDGGPIRHVEYFCVNANRRYLDEAHVARFRQVVRAYDLVVWSVHAPFDDCDISAEDEGGRRRAIADVTAALDLAVALEAGVVVVHGSGEPIAAPERETRLRQCVRSLNELCKRASQRGLRLALELLPRSCLGNRTTEVRWLLDIVDGDLRVCYDVNHITLYEDVGTSLRALGERIATLHISDHDGIDERHWIPGRGIVPWGAFVDGLDAIGYTGCLMHEAYDNNLDVLGNLRAIAEAARTALRWKPPV